VTSLVAVVVGIEQRALLLGVGDSRSATIGRLAVLFGRARGSRAPGSRHAHLHRELTTLGTRFEP
jgi:hypothetical protein